MLNKVSINYEKKALEQILANQKDLEQVAEKISSGKNFNQVADSPAEAIQAIYLKQHVKEIEQFQKNCQNILSAYEVTMNVVSSYRDDLSKITELLMRGASGTATSYERNLVSMQLERYLDKCLYHVNFRDLHGRRIFSGLDQGRNVVNQIKPGIFEYHGDTGIRYAEISQDIKIPQNILAAELFFDIRASTPDVIENESLFFNKVALNDFQGDMTPTADPRGTKFLRIQNQNIRTYPDKLSSAYSNFSAQAIAQACAQSPDLNLQVKIIPAIMNLGVMTNITSPLTLHQGEFLINEIPITGTFSQQNNFIQTINLKLKHTGIKASLVDGEFILQSSDGRNVQVITAPELSLFPHHPNNSCAFGEVVFLSKQPMNIGVGENLSLIELDRDLNYQVDHELYTEELYQKPKNIFLLNFDDNYYHSDASNTFLQKAPNNSIRYNYGSFTIKKDDINLSDTISSKCAIGLELKYQSSSILQIIYDAIGTMKDHQNPNQSETIKKFLGMVGYALEKAINIEAEIGSRMILVEKQKEYNDDMLFHTQQQISLIEDLELPAAIAEFSNKKLVLEAAQKSYSQLNELGLFKYL